MRSVATITPPAASFRRTYLTEPSILTVVRERQLTHVLRAFIITGVLFMLLPGTFLGVWNLLSISSHTAFGGPPAAWLQAHGHAQIFGWLGSFIMGIGFYSLPSGRRTTLRKAWTCWAMWLSGVSLRWFAGVYAYEWRLLLPLSALLELTAFAVFYKALSGHRPQRPSGPLPVAAPTWIGAVLLGTIGFGTALVANAIAACVVTIEGVDPAMPPAFNQRWLVLVAWGFLVPTVFGFTARWLPTFMGLSAPNERTLRAALRLIIIGCVFAAFGWMMLSSIVLTIACGCAIAGLRVSARAERPAKTRGVHASMPIFIRLAYVWLLVSAVLSILAAGIDRHNGYWGASRHALTVGFLAAMVFTIGPRILPHFAGVKNIYSTRLMFFVLLLINAGCLVRVSSEIVAYEYFYATAWRLLPVSAVLELLAVSLFAANILFTFAFSPTTFVDTCFAPQHGAIAEN